MSPVPADPYDFSNGSIADAEQVDARFAALFHALDPAVTGLDRSNVKGGLLKLNAGAVVDRKLAFGTYTTGGFGGSRQITENIPHGLGATPAFAIVGLGWIGAADTSSAHDEPVSCVVSGQDATNLAVKFILPPGVTAAVGSSVVFWAAIA